MAEEIWIPMKLLFIIDSLGTGGAERSTSQLWYYLRAHEINFSIIAFSKRSDGIQQEILNEKFPVHYILNSGLESVRKLANEIELYKPDIVHSILFKSNIRTRLAKLISNHRFIHVESLVNCNYDKSRLNDPNINFFKLKGYQGLDYFTQIFLTNHYHANGVYVADHYKKALHINDKKITIVHRGREDNPFLENKKEVKFEVRRELGIPPDGRIIIHVGRQEFQKAHDVLLKGIPPVLQNFPKVYLLLAGREGNNSKIIKEILNNISSDRIITLGHRYDIPKLLVASDIFVLPSRFEGLPGSLIEAEAAGLPIVATNIPTVEEVAKDNINSILFSRDNPEELRNALIRLLKDKNLRENYGKQSLCIFNEKFRIENANQKMLKMYENLFLE